MDVAVDRGGWVGAEGADRAGGGGCVESVGGEGGLEGGVGERVGRNGARVSKDEGLMDSGEWLEELRSGFGSQDASTVDVEPASQEGEQHARGSSGSAGSGSEVKGWGAEFEEDGHDIETGTWLDTLKADFEEKMGAGRASGGGGGGRGDIGTGSSGLNVNMDEEKSTAAEDAARVRVLEALDVPDDLQDAADSAGAAVLAALLQGHRRMLVEIHDPLLDPHTSGGSGFGGGNEAATYAENLASAVELLVLPTAAALEGLPELARNRVKLLFQSQRQLTAARATMTFLSDKVDMAALTDGEAGAQVDDEHDALLVLVACQAEEDADAAELMKFFKAGANCTILVFNPAVHDGGSDYDAPGGAITEEDFGDDSEYTEAAADAGFGGAAFDSIEVNDADGKRGHGDDPAIYESFGALDDLQAELAAYESVYHVQHMTVNYVSKGGAAGTIGVTGTDVGAGAATTAVANRGLDRKGGEVGLGMPGAAYGGMPVGLGRVVGDTEEKGGGAEGDEGSEAPWAELSGFGGDDYEIEVGDSAEGEGLLSDDDLGGDEDEDEALLGDLWQLDGLVMVEDLADVTVVEGFFDDDVLFWSPGSSSKTLFKGRGCSTLEDDKMLAGLYEDEVGLGDEQIYVQPHPDPYQYP
mmetsp:Transcript_87500/g.248676  ORF Transcript_87500/g.248676 Transcript_87500/m.248676 type:complete len:640 (-) Transcript_87500:454-2373(-)